ncbi:MAG: hypothetical protein JJ877_01045 [Thalassococcus sp.]|nr:hypothetical protein [Thalassococcus sp.]MBO6865601.1 hypothetical protein [Thalassococcus sp.]
MKTRTRFIKSVLNTAATTETKLPWERGATRQAMIAKRDAQPAAQKRA